MQRRSFLKGFLGAAVGAGLVAACPRVLQEVVTLTPSPTFYGWVGRTNNAECGKITYEMLEQAYKDACIGHPPRPDVIVMSKRSYKKLVKLFGCSDYTLAPIPKPTWI